MSHEGGPDSTQQRTVAELLAMYGGESGERAPRRRRRRPDDVSDTGAHSIIERVNSESAKLAPIRDDQPPPSRTSHRQRHGQTPAQGQPPPAEPRQAQPRPTVPPPARQTPPRQPAPPSLPKLPAVTYVEPTRPVQPPRRARRAAPQQPAPPPTVSGSFARPPAADPNSATFVRPADPNSGSFARPPAADPNSGSFVRPPEAKSGTFVRPPVPEGNATADTFIRPPSPELGGKSGTFVRPPAQGAGYFPPPAPAKPEREDVTEQLPRVGPPAGTRTGQQPAPFPPGRTDFGPQTQVTNGFGPDRYAADLELDDEVRYPEEDDDLDRDDFDRDDFDVDEARSPGREWLVMVVQVALSVVGGAGVWLGFNWLWGKLPQAALGAAIVVIVGLVWIVRKIRRADDLQTTGLAVLVGLFVTVSPAALLLLSK